MTPEQVIDIISHAVYVMLSMVAVLIVPGLVVGLIIAVFQAATQINEQTLSMIPRLFATFLSLVIAGPWLLQLIMGFTQRLINDIPYLIG